MTGRQHALIVGQTSRTGYVCWNEVKWSFETAGLDFEALKIASNGRRGLPVSACRIDARRRFRLQHFEVV